MANDQVERLWEGCVWEVSNGGLGPALAAITAEEANHQRAPVQPTLNAAEPAFIGRVGR